MKVRCIIKAEGFTEGKIYVVQSKVNNSYIMKNDYDKNVAALCELFEEITLVGLDVLEVPKTQHTHPIVQTGIKHDSGKLKPTLLLDDMPLAIQEVLKVLKFGAEKYSEGNWLKVDNGINRYRNAADRHRLQSPINDIDDESGLLHLAHEATSILMLLELKLRGGK